MKFRLLRVFMVFGVAVVIFCNHPALAEEALQGGKTILVLHTFEAKIPWVLLFNRYLKEELQQSDLPPYEVNIENLDLVQFNDDAYKQILKRKLEYQYANSDPDIVIITFPAAIEFVLENDLFRHVPKIFVLPSKARFENIPNSIVVPFAYDLKGNIEHALDLLPDTKEIYVVAGNDSVDKRTVELFRNDTREFENRISFHYLTEMDVDEVLRSVENLPPHSFVYYLSYTADLHGRMIVSVDLCRLVGKRSNRPVLTYFDLFALNTGILGGRVTTTRASVTSSVDIVKRIFQGETIDSINVALPYFEYIYDWGELVKWNIKTNILPPESIIQNRTYTFFELAKQFKWQILGGVLLATAEFLLIVFLLINVKKRKTAENSLLEYQAKLEIKVENRTEELRLANCDLQKALDEIKTLQGIIPICSFCHKIRDDEGAWNQLESYISKHSKTEFSHAVCPECMEKHYHKTHK